MADHAKLSASSSHKWLNCTPSVALEENFENKTSTFAEEGTAAHTLAEHKLRKFLKIKTKKPISQYDSQELDFYTDAYVGYACELIAEAKTRSSDPLALVEQRLDYSHYAPEGFGTGDLVIVSDGFTGPQGLGKSTFLRLLGRRWYSDSLTTFDREKASRPVTSGQPSPGV